MNRVLLVLLAGAAAPCPTAAEALVRMDLPGWPRVAELDPGDVWRLDLGGATRRIELLASEIRTRPEHAIPVPGERGSEEAVARVRIDGVAGEVRLRPFAMPQDIGGLRLYLAHHRGWCALAGADNDFETDAAILRNWLHDATFPMFFARQLPGAEIVSEQPGRLEGRAAWFAVIKLPEGSARLRLDPQSGLPVREDSYRGLVVFSRGDHTYLIMKEVTPDMELPAVLPELSGFYEGMTFADDHPFFASLR